MCKWMCKWMGVSDAHPKWMGRVSCDQAVSAVRRHSLSYQAHHDGALSGARASSKVSKLSDHELAAADHELTAAM